MRAIGFLLLLFSVSLALAQENSSSGVVGGKVVDEAGAPIERVEIVLTNRQGERFVDTSSSDGDFRVSVPAGIYSVRAEYKEHRAWQVFSLERFKVRSRKENKLSITLKIDRKWIALHGTPVTGRPVKETDGGDRRPVYTLTGTILDTSGAVIVGAKVTAREKGGKKWEAIVNENGMYTLRLPSSTFILKASKEWFCPTVIQRYMVVDSTFGKMSLDFALEVASSHTRCEYTDEIDKTDKN